jgi:transposase InsO family protein
MQTDNAFAESLYGHLTAECLNRPQSASLEEARQAVEVWRIEDYAERPHQALKQQTPGSVEAASAPCAEAADERFGRTKLGPGQ